MAFFEFPHTRSYDSDLGWLIKEYSELSAAYQTLTDCCSDVQDRLEALETFKNTLESGVLPNSVKHAIEVWLQNNALDFIGDLATSVFFGLTDNGYFVAYIPETWKDIVFNTTGYDITVLLQPEYGHLVLSY